MERLIADLKKQQVKVVLQDKQLKLVAPKDALSPATLEEIRFRKEELIAYLEKYPDTFYEHQGLTVIEEQEHYPASDAQRRMWVINQFEENKTAYNIPMAYAFSGKLQADAFEKAFVRVVQRHESLRTVFLELNGELRQKVISDATAAFRFSFIDLSDMPDAAATAQEIMAKESTVIFSLEQGPLLRSKLLKTAADKYVFLLNMHHIISDGWSVEILLKEVLFFYNAFTKGTAHNLPALRSQYREYTVWQQHNLATGKYEKAAAYWKNRFTGPIPVLELPADKPRPVFMTANGRQQWFSLDAKIVQQLSEISKQERASWFMLFIATFKALFFKYTAQEDIVIGTPVANRTQEELEGQIGLYMNTLALRTQFNGSGSFKALLQQVKNTILDANNFQDYPFDKLVDDLDLKRDLSRSPLFDVMITVPADATAAAAEVIDGIEINTFPGNTSTTQFDLSIDVVSNGDTFNVSLIYNTDIYEDERIERLFTHYNRLLTAIAQDPHKPLHQLEYLTDEETKQLVHGFNAVDQQAPVPDQNYVEAFIAQVNRTPQHIAVQCGEESLTYGELDQASSKLAHWLLENGLKKGEFVPLLFDRSVETLMAIIGVLKAGGAFMLLDPTYPLKRMTDLVSDTSARIIIAKSNACTDWNSFWTGMSETTNLRTAIWLDQSAPIFANTAGITLAGSNDWHRQPAEQPQVKILPGDTSFIIYTSGSTGKPKGALNLHIGMQNHCLIMVRQFEIDEQSVVAQTAPPSFDISVWQLITGVLTGAKTVIYPQHLIHNPAALLKEMQQDGVTVVQWVPSYLTAILEELKATPEESFFPVLKYLILCGEAIRPALVKEWFRYYPKVKVANAYGPAEASDDVTINIVSAATFDGKISIGKPVDNCRIYILDKYRQLCPVNHIGEICVAGIAVGGGYLNEPEKTNAVFLDDPFTGNDQRMYCTGDLGRWLPDGSLEFIGRKDHQVKIRGQRVELGEVEILLLKHDSVNQAIVLDIIDEQQNTDLVAFIVTADTKNRNTPDVVKSWLEQQVPAFMIPSRFVQLEEMPLTDNGKVDRKALKIIAATGNTAAEKTILPPANDTEACLLKLWKEVLAKENISVADNFFDIGGHSLKAVRLISGIYRALGTRIELKEVFLNNTIQKQAVWLKSAAATGYAEILPVPMQPHYEVSHAQRRIWLSEQTHATGAYNIPESFELIGEIDVECFDRAFRYLVQRHEALRTTFITVDGEPRQVIHPADNFPFAVELSDLRDNDDKETVAAALVEKEAWRPFPLDKAPLMHARMIRLEDTRFIFILTMHHIISDGWSLDIIIKEVLTVYSAYLAGETPELPPMKIHYKDYSAWQVAELSGNRYQEHRDYWTSQFASGVPVLELPLDGARPALKSYNGATVRKSIDLDLKNKIEQLANREGSTLFMALTAAINTLLYKYTGQEDIIIGASVSDRSHPDLENQIGFFVNMLPLRNTFSGADSFIELLKGVKTTTLNAFAHQVYPFDMIVDDLHLVRDLSRTPLFDVVVTMQENEIGEDTSNQLQHIQVNDYDKKTKLAKFDITVFFAVHEGGIETTFLYNTDLFSETRMQGMIAHFGNLLEEVLKEPEMPLKALPLLSGQEKATLLTFARPALKIQVPGMLTHEMIEEQATIHPDAIALVYKGTPWTYRQMNEEANGLAYYLREQQQVKPGDLVAIMMERSDKMIICLLAIMKAGAAWLPVDVSFPDKRKADILQDATPALLITESGYMFNLEYYTGALFITDIQWDELTPVNTNLPAIHSQEDPVYVIYTSGSTGRPKGVVLPHRALAAYLQWFKSAFDTAPGDSTLMLSSIAFDLGYTSLWGALVTGATVVINGSGEYFDREEFVQWLTRDKVTFLKLTPSHLDVLVNDPAFPQEAAALSLRLIITGGESIRPDDIARLLTQFPDIKIVNHYGPTETTIGTLAHIFDQHSFAAFSRKPILGRPIADNRVYILDNAMQLAPVGVAGEICVAGTGLATGYLHLEELTSQKFTADPFSKGRLYRTGDLGYYTATGEIAFIGRKDNQVKIRGFRVETDDVESVLLKHSAVRNALVTAWEHNKQYALVAYYQENEPVTEESLREYLKTALPDYMIPAYFMRIEEFPLTLNGKINRQQLPLPGVATTIAMQEPKNSLEEKLVEVWKDILGLKELSTLANFFSIGGDSIKAIQVASRMSRAGFRIGVKEIFENPILLDLARHVKEIARTASQLPVEGGLPLTPIQQRFLQSGYTQWQHYNQSVLFRSEKRWTAAGLRKVFARIQEHHDALRITLKTDEAGNWMQVNNGLDMIADFTDFDLREEKEPATVMATIAGQLQAAFDLANGPLMKVALFHLPDGDRLLVIVHHLVVDGVSWRILEEDIQTLYEQYENNQPLTLPLKTDAYKLWAEQLQAYVKTPECRDELGYWLSLTADPLPEMPQDHSINADLQQDRAANTFELDEQTTAILVEKVPNAFGTDINDILLTALICAMETTFSINKCLVALEGHGREELFGEEMDINRTVGWFTSVYPVLLDTSRADNLPRKIIHIKESLHRIPQKGIRYGMLRYLGTQEEQEILRRQQQPRISFNYLGEFNGTLKVAEEDQGPNTHSSWSAFYALAVGGIVLNKRLNISIEYNTTQYEGATMDNLIQAYKAALLEIITCCAGQKERVLTPSDLTYKDIPETILEETTARLDIDDIYPLSPLQTGMLFLAGIQTEDAYFRQVYYSLQGNLQEKFVEKSFQALFLRHDILRTMFVDDMADIPLQIVLKNRKPEFLYLDLSALTTADQEKYVSDFRTADKNRGFRLDNDILMRMAVLKLSDNNFDIVWSYHHILMDGWCSAILINEFFEIYNALLQGVNPVFESVTPYREYIRWLHKQDRQLALQHWKDYLEEYNELATLPAWKHTQTEDYLLGKQELVVPETLTAALHTLAAANGITLNVILQSVWGILLGAYNNREDVVFGAVVSGRPAQIPGIETMVGLFVNTIPVRVQCDAAQSVTELLRNMQSQAVANAPYHYCQLAEIQQASTAGTQLLDHIIVFENYPIAEKVDEQVEALNERDKGVWNFSINNLEHEERSHYNCYLIIAPGSAINVQFGYNQAVYDPAQIKLLSEHFLLLLNEVANDPAQQLSALFAQLPQQQLEHISRFNKTALVYDRDETIIGRFNKVVAAYPAAPAVITDKDQLTYEELDKMSTRLAVYLQQQLQVKAGEPVGVMTERSVYMAVGMIGILKAGAAYVPIDPAYPIQRRNYILSDTGMQYLLTDKESLDASELTCQAIALPQVLQENVASQEPLLQHTRATDLAYIIYTSGSTGIPNGVMVPHRGAVNMFVSQQHHFKVSAADRILQFASLSFDASVWECIMALLSGAALVMVRKEVIDDPLHFANYIADKKVTIMTLPPVYLSVLEKEKLKGVRVLITAGEEARIQESVDYSADLDCWNAYGPSECAVCVSMYKVSPADSTRARVPIGIPIANTHVYILGKDNRILPVGVTGEIAVTGDCVGLGYWKREELTDRKFILLNGERCYRTGDMGRLLPDGNLEFLGRIDDQVKIRGHRIEIGEVLNSIKSHPEVEEAFITTGTTGPDKYLVAYFTSQGTVDEKVLMDFIRGTLPEFMVPAYLLRLDKFPLTPNGKIDRKALPEPQAIVNTTDFQQPATSGEQLLAELWTKLLGRDNISSNDNFYQVGGDSIKAMQIAARLHRMGYGTTARDILQHPVLSDLAKTLHKQQTLADQSVVTGNAPLTPIQHWLLESDNAVHHFNQSVMLRFKDRINADVMKKVHAHLQHHHDALRMTFHYNDSQWQQRNENTELPVFWQEHDLTTTADPEQEMNALTNSYQESIVLESGPLMKPIRFILPEADYLLIVMHHLVVDGVSWRILLEDIHTLYLQLTKGEEPALPAKTHSFKHWGEALQQYATNNELLKEKAWWSAIDKKIQAGQQPGKYLLRNFDQHRFTVSTHTTAALTSTANTAFQTETNDLILAGFALAAKKVFGTDDLLLSMEGHGREQIKKDIDVSRTVGWFTAMYPLAIAANGDIRNVIINTKETLRNIPHKGIGYGILKYLSPGAQQEDVFAGQLPGISYNYLGHFDEVTGNGLFEVTGGEGRNFSNDRAWDFTLSVSAYIKDGQLTVSLAYNNELYDATAIDRLATAFTECLDAIVTFCVDHEKTATPSDMTLKGLSVNELDLLSKGLY